MPLITNDSTIIGDDRPVRSSLSDDEGGSEEEDEEAGSEHESDDEPPPRRYAFPELDDKIRMCIKEYGAVFPKLNFSAPKVRSFSWSSLRDPHASN